MDQPLNHNDLAAATEVLGTDLEVAGNASLPIPVRPPFYIPGSAPADAGIVDAYGTAYLVRKDRSIIRVGPKKPKL